MRTGLQTVLGCQIVEFQAVGIHVWLCWQNKPRIYHDIALVVANTTDPNGATTADVRSNSSLFDVFGFLAV